MKRLSKSIVLTVMAVLLAFALVGCQSTAKKVETIPPAPVVVEEQAPAATVAAPAVTTEKPAAPVAEKKAEPVAPAKAAEPVSTPAAKPVAPTSEYPYGVNTTVKNAKGDKEFDLFVVHTNDMDGVFSGEKNGMSLAQLATLVNVGGKITDNWLLLNAGNIGVTEANAMQVAKAIDAVGYDAYTPQAIQLATGITGTSKAVALSANALDANGYLCETPYQVYSFNGFKVAVVGLTAPKEVNGVSFTSDVILQNAQAAVSIAKKYVDYVVVLADTTSEGAWTSEMICENLKGIDLFVASGDEPMNKVVNGARIVTASPALQSVGVVQLHVKDGKVTATYPMSVPASAITSPAQSDLVKSYASALKSFGIDPTAAVPENATVAALLPAPYGIEIVKKETTTAKSDVVKSDVVKSDTVKSDTVKKEPVVNKVFDLIVVHTNDVHGRIVPADGGMGYAKLATLLKMGRSITDNILLLDAGDVSHGTNLDNMFQGETSGVLLSMLKYDAVAPGNHDFNYGKERLIESAQLAEKYTTTRVLCANITKENGENVFQPYQLYDYNGFKVAVLGLSTPDTKTMSHPKNTEGLDFHEKDFYELTQKYVDKLHKIADYVIVLGHMGVSDVGGCGITSKTVCQNVKGIDLFVDGHSHTELKQGEKVGDTLIVQAGQYMKDVGVVDILVKDGKAVSTTAMLIPADAVLNPEKSDLAKKYGITSVPDDPEVSAYIASMQKKLDKEMNVVVATLPTNLDGERANVRTRQTNLSKMICTAMTEESGADFTITNGGGIRASLKKGNVTVGDINTVLPFTNIITVCEITGEEVYQALEHGYSKLPEAAGMYSQTDLQVVYNRFAPAGKRILRVLLNGKAIDRNATYKVASNDFMAAGGDGYTMFGKLLTQGKQLNEVFIEYLKKQYPVK